MLNDNRPIVFCVDDEESIRDVYEYSLERDFSVQCFPDAKAFFDTLENKKPDIVILDVMLEGKSGYEILSFLKEKTDYKNIPVIMVSAKGLEIDKVKGLNSGADDYISKPFGVLELIARIKANLRKVSPKSEIICFKDLKIDEPKHTASVKGEALELTVKEYDLLKLLVKKADTVVLRDALLDEVWGENYGETRTLDIHIAKLRKALNFSDAEIETVRGVGYILK